VSVKRGGEKRGPGPGGIKAFIQVGRGQWGRNRSQSIPTGTNFKSPLMEEGPAHSKETKTRAICNLWGERGGREGGKGTLRKKRVCCEGGGPCSKPGPAEKTK